MGCGDGETKADNSQTLEVAFARVYNWDVAQRRKDREADEAGEADDKGKGKK